MVNKLIRILMLIITLICLAASIYYSGLWHLYVKMSPMLAWGLAAAFVIFANVCFDIAVGLFRGENKLAYVFIGLWSLITVYSIGSTIAGQYNQMLLQTASVYEVSELQLNINNLEIELTALRTPPGADIKTRDILIQDITRRITSLESEQDSINKMISNVDDIETSANYRTTIKNNRERLVVVQSQLDILYTQKTTLLMPVKLDTNRITELQTEIMTLKKERDAGITDEEKLALQDDIFDFLTSVFKPMIPGITADLIQFITSIFPAILIDLLSPISSALFFYGIKIEKKDDEYKKGASDAFETVNTELRRRLQDTVAS